MARRDFAVDPAALETMKATLAFEAHAERAAAPQPEALSALEEALVQKKQKELELASERERLRKELAGLSRARLDELQNEQALAVDRLDAETAARAAERAAVARDVEALEFAHSDASKRRAGTFRGRVLAAPPRGCRAPGHPSEKLWRISRVRTATSGRVPRSKRFPRRSKRDPEPPTGDAAARDEAASTKKTLRDSKAALAARREAARAAARAEEDRLLEEKIRVAAAAAALEAPRDGEALDRLVRAAARVLDGSDRRDGWSLEGLVAAPPRPGASEVAAWSLGRRIAATPVPWRTGRGAAAAWSLGSLCRGGRGIFGGRIRGRGLRRGYFRDRVALRRSRSSRRPRASGARNNASRRCSRRKTSGPSRQTPCCETRRTRSWAANRCRRRRNSRRTRRTGPPRSS